MTPAKGFAEMKDSGIEWVGMIPNHWTTIANKYVMHKEKHICEKWDGQDVLSLTMNGVIIRDILNPVGKMPTTFDGYQFAYAGELLMCLFDIDVTPRCVGRVFNDGVTSPAYSCFQLNDNADLGYFYYYYLMVDNTKELLHLAKNLRHSFTEEQLGQLKVPLPPLQEQSAIASYLDTQCAKIDEIIAQAKASIEDYKQWKASIIYEAVTKGLNPNVEMKDSGIEWIGKVPMRWKIVRLKYLLSTPLQYGANETGLPYDESLPRYIRITDITLDGKLKTSGMQSLSEEKSEGYILDDEDILLARSGATVGKAFYYRESYGKAAFAGYLIRAKINSAKALPKFIYYSTMSAGYEKWKETAVIQATIQNIGASRYNEYSLAIPPIAEQLRIIEFLDDKMEKIDSLMAEKQSLIGDLESYKKSLIYEVVTGKRRV